MMDTVDQAPEVTIEPADNGFVVRHYQRSKKKDESGRTVRRVASSTDEALRHAKTALHGGGSGKDEQKKPGRRGSGAPIEGAIGEHAPHHAHAPHALRDRVRRRRRTGGRR